MKQKIKEAFTPVLNRVRCLDKHVTGNIKLAEMLVEALPTEVQDAIELSVPDKPINTKLRATWSCCPRCGSHVSSLTCNFCANCGQRLDWSEE